MKKTFKLKDLETNNLRRVESIKNEVRKYIKRERNKKLPDGVDFWDFDCKFGPAAAEAKEIHLSQISKCIEEADARQEGSFYLEILVKHGQRIKKPKTDPDQPKI